MSYTGKAAPARDPLSGAEVAAIREAVAVGRLTAWHGRDLLAEYDRLTARVAELEALAADATEYRVLLPEGGGTELRVSRSRAGRTAGGWAVAVPGFGGGRAWTQEGWQDSISALSVDRLFCWPDAQTAVAAARRALAAGGAL